MKTLVCTREPITGRLNRLKSMIQGVAGERKRKVSVSEEVYRSWSSGPFPIEGAAAWVQRERESSSRRSDEFFLYNSPWPRYR